MNKKLMTGLATGMFLFCGIGTSFSAPLLKGSAKWFNAGVEHEYTLYSFSSGDDDKNWSAIQAWVTTSQSPGSHLATITTKIEDEFINSSFFNGSIAFGEVWLGGYQTPVTNPLAAPVTNPLAGWAWVTNEVWEYTNWSPGEANDAYGQGSEQHLGGNWKKGQWNDEGKLDDIKGFLVENSTPSAPVPEPGTIFLVGTCLAGLAAVGRRKRS